MALKTFKARSQGMRFRIAPTFEEITEKKPVKSLTRAVRKTVGKLFIFLLLLKIQYLLPADYSIIKL